MAGSIGCLSLSRISQEYRLMHHHAHSIDRWDDATGSSLYEHFAGVNDFLLARATFAAAVERWPDAKITLRNGARIIEKTWPADD
jgi:hypothetical protein